MKQTKNYALFAFILPIIIVILFGMGLSCESSKPPATGSNCPYEGLECPNAERYARDYQLELLSDSTQIWDGDRLVSTIHYSASIDSVLLLDNQ